jgi:hypothetical protein
MSTLDTYDAIVSRRLGTTSENFHTDESRTSAINLAVKEFTEEYQPQELRSKAYVDFERYGAPIDRMEYANDAAIQAVWDTPMGDAGAALADTNDPKIGLTSGEFPAVFATGTGYWLATDNLTSIDVSDYVGTKRGDPTEGYLGFWMKVSDYTALTQARISVGHAASYRVYFDILDFVTIEDNDWHYYKLPLVDSTSVNETQWTAIDSMRLTLTLTADVTVNLDDVKIIPNNSDWMVADMPSDLSTMNRILKSEDTNNSQEFIPTDPDSFYRRPGDYITYDYSVVDATRRLFINDTNVDKLLLHYVKDATEMSGGTDDSTLGDDSIEIIALFALRRLLLDSGEYDKAETLNSREIRDAVATWAGLRSRLSTRLKSKYERINFHSR